MFIITYITYVFYDSSDLRRCFSPVKNTTNAICWAQSDFAEMALFASLIYSDGGTVNN